MKISKAKRRVWAGVLPWYLNSIESLTMQLSELVRYNSKGLSEAECAWVQERLDYHRKWTKQMREFSRRVRASVQ
jgi:hypothetical protein